MHYVIGAVIGLVCGGVLGFAFRGKESAFIHQTDAKAKSIVGGVEKKL